MAKNQEEQEVKVMGVVETDVADPPAPKMFKLTINSEESVEGRSDVFVGLNGYGYNIKRNMEVVVPEGVVEILKNTVINTTAQGGEPQRISRYNITYSPA